MTHTQEAVGIATVPDQRRWAVLAMLSVAQFMLILDVTVVNIALPHMGSDLHLGREALTWVVTAYTLVFGGLMLTGGRLADALGARRTLLTGLALFTLASLAAGLAPNAAVLLSSRIAQGLGAALLSPSALAIITRTFHGPERTKALGVWSALAGAGSAAGVLLGGAITAGLGWRWVFFVNVPVGLAVLVLLPMVVRAQPATRDRIDVLGAALVTLGTGSLIYGLVEAGGAGWSAPSTLVPLTLAAALYALFALVEHAVRAPLMDMRLLGRRPVFSGAFLMLVATALLIAMFFLGSLYLQRIRHDGPLQTGLLFLPAALGAATGAHLAGHLVNHVGGRFTAAGGLAVAAGGFTLLTGVNSLVAAVLPGFLLASLGIGAVFVAATTTALGHIDHGQAGVASGIVNTFHEVGGSIGVAVLSTIAAAGIQHGTTAGFGSAFTFAAITAAVGAAAVLVIAPSGTPDMPSGVALH
jgi:EmrB/QacA subfamily drug resistance transporter